MFWLDQFNSSADLQKASKDANMLAYFEKSLFESIKLFFLPLLLFKLLWFLTNIHLCILHYLSFKYSAQSLFISWQPWKCLSIALRFRLGPKPLDGVLVSSLLLYTTCRRSAEWKTRRWNYVVLCKYAVYAAQIRRKTPCSTKIGGFWAEYMQIMCCSHHKSEHMEQLSSHLWKQTIS